MKEKILYSVITLSIVVILFIGGLFLAKGMSVPSNENEVTVAEKNQIYNDQTAQFVHESPTDVLGNLENEKPGIYYFGFPTCPWCLELLPVLDSVLAEQHVTAYAVNIRSDGYTSMEKEKLTSFFKKHTQQQEIAVPFVVAINKEGQVNTHIGTVPEHDATKQKMSEEQVVTLRSELTKMFQ